MVVIYSTQWCAPCKIAKQLLDAKKVNYKEIDIEKQRLIYEIQKLKKG